jgi:hypothetical protein
MIAFATQLKRKRSRPDGQQAFLQMLPIIMRHAKFAFRFMPPEAREEAVAEVVAICWAAFTRLVERKKQHVAAPSALARFAVARIRDGRRLTGRESSKDAMSAIARYRKGFGLGQLDQYDREEGAWREIVVEDRRAGPAEIACCRLDFAAWLRLLPKRLRKIALVLARGETTGAAAKRFGVTPARVSQLRLRLMDNWEAFQGQATASQLQTVAV